MNVVSNHFKICQDKFFVIPIDRNTIVLAKYQIFIGI